MQPDVPSSQAPMRLFRRVCALATAAALTLTSPLPAQAQGGGSKYIPLRDAEVEELLRDYTTPIFKAAGINASATQIILIKDFSFNAFVANGQKIFLNVGALVQSKTPNELIGVLAHEAGHIAGGHLTRMHQQAERAQTRAMIAMLLGTAALGAAAAGGGNENLAAAGQAAILGPQSMIMRDMLSYRRALEQAADQAAVSYLTKTGQSAKGMLDTFRRFADESLFSARYADPYAQSHPMPMDRIQFLENLATKSPHFKARDSDTLLYRHAMAQAKSIGFLRPRETVMRTYPARDTSMPARYARAIAEYQNGRIDDAIRQIDDLIRAQPDNPYFWELKGQALLEKGRVKDAVQPLQRAVALAKERPAALIRILLGQALVAYNQPKAAIDELNRALIHEKDSPEAYRALAMAYGRTGDIARADLASAQATIREGDVKLARQLAARAKSRFPAGSPGWLQADDIVNYREPKPE